MLANFGFGGRLRFWCSANRTPEINRTAIARSRNHRLRHLHIRLPAAQTKGPTWPNGERTPLQTSVKPYPHYPVVPTFPTPAPSPTARKPPLPALAAHPHGQAAQPHLASSPYPRHLPSLPRLVAAHLLGDGRHPARSGASSKQRRRVESSGGVRRAASAWIWLGTAVGVRRAASAWIRGSSKQGPRRRARSCEEAR